MLDTAAAGEKLAVVDIDGKGAMRRCNALYADGAVESDSYRTVWRCRREWPTLEVRTGRCATVKVELNALNARLEAIADWNVLRCQEVNGDIVSPMASAVTSPTHSKSKLLRVLIGHRRGPAR